MESNGNTVDDWESNADLDKENDLNNKFTKLNVNAAEFVPSFVIPTSKEQSQTPDKLGNGELTPDNPPLAGSFIYSPC